MYYTQAKYLSPPLSRDDTQLGMYYTQAKYLSGNSRNNMIISILPPPPSPPRFYKLADFQLYTELCKRGIRSIVLYALLAFIILTKSMFIL